MVAFPADNAWGDWAIGRLYLPLIHQIVGYLAGRVPDSGRVRLEPAGTGEAQTAGVSIENERAVVRNIDPTESDPERATEETLRQVYRLPFSSPERRAAGQGDEEPPAGSARSDELWRYILSALLAILVVETFVANRTYA